MRVRGVKISTYFSNKSKTRFISFYARNVSAHTFDVLPTENGFKRANDVALNYFFL